jgi:hypothetical protein
MDAPGALLERNEAWSEINNNLDRDEICMFLHLEPDNIPLKVRKLPPFLARSVASDSGSGPSSSSSCSSSPA